VSTERVLRNTAATITVTFYNGTTAVDADGNVTVTVTRADGTILLSTPATNEAGTGVYSVVIPPQATLNMLTVTWTGLFTGTSITIESSVEIVGGFYFSIAELRGYDSVLANTTRFPNSALIDARTSVEAEFEDICQRAFVPRFYRETLIGETTDELFLEKPEVHSVTKFTVDGTDHMDWVTGEWVKFNKYSIRSLVLSGLALSAGYATGIDIEYEYGMKRVPYPIKEKALKRAKGNLVGMGSTIDPRATTMSLPDIGTVNLSTPGLRGAETGIPDIDVVLRRYSLASGGIY
jgi:hypothetical protein